MARRKSLNAFFGVDKKRKREEVRRNFEGLQRNRRIFCGYWLLILHEKCQCLKLKFSQKQNQLADDHKKQKDEQKKID
ncbi:hypothetical protein DASC09_050990 [Saccharomycopsis crataegensis]|uniref:Uncharacterized protein n=1 Tax=Saccharomycopsis crataegensis TaxID=43959 RepID=A0AAV5QSN8_9ASCO|nr:hypothetical protein DASC09_050990 [Saccharomycopsis crataegensis]